MDDETGRLQITPEFRRERRFHQLLKLRRDSSVEERGRFLSRAFPEKKIRFGEAESFDKDSLWVVAAADPYKLARIAKGGAVLAEIRAAEVLTAELSSAPEDPWGSKGLTLRIDKVHSGLPQEIEDWRLTPNLWMLDGLAESCQPKLGSFRIRGLDVSRGGDAAVAFDACTLYFGSVLDLIRGRTRWSVTITGLCGAFWDEEAEQVIAITWRKTYTLNRQGSILDCTAQPRWRDIISKDWWNPIGMEPVA